MCTSKSQPSLSEPALGTNETYAGLVIEQLERAGDRVVLIDESGSFTGEQLLFRVATLQNSIRAASDQVPRVAILSRNLADAWAMQIAAMALGGSVVWLHPRGSVSDHLRVIVDARPNVLLVDPGVPSGCAEPTAKAFREYGVVFCTSDMPDAQCLPSQSYMQSPPEVSTVCRPDDVALLAYTGGTTGAPKGVIRTQAQWALVARAVLDSYGMPSNCRFLAAGPISHVTGTFLLPVLMSGGVIHLQGSSGRGAVLAAIERWKIDVTILVPTAIESLLDEISERPTSVSTLRKVFWGGSSMAPEALKRAWRRLGPVVHQVYGQTEAYPLCGMTPQELSVAVDDPALEHRWRSCGFPVRSIEISIQDPSGHPVADGQVGEIVVRGGQVMSGYFNDSKERAAHWRPCPPSPGRVHRDRGSQQGHRNNGWL